MIFYVAGPKALPCLQHFCKENSAKKIYRVVSYRNLNNIWFDSIKNFCKDNAIKFIEQTESLNEEDKFLKLAIGWQFIIRNMNNLIIFHDSLLPKYKGFSPLVNGLINGEKTFGLSSLIASSQFDEGDIIYQDKISITYPIKINNLINKIIPLYLKQLTKLYKDYKTGKNFKTRKQNLERATYSMWLDEKDYYIDWSWSAYKVRNFINAVGSPYSLAKTTLSGKVIFIESCEVIEDINIVDRKRHIGKIFSTSINEFSVICGEGILLVTKYLLPESDEELKINLRNRLI